MGIKGNSFSVKVVENVVVHANDPWNDHWLPFTNLDLLVPPFDVGSFFCYKKPSQVSFPTLVNTLKASLTRALSLYYPLAGEILWNADARENQIRCNNRGVDFVEATADVQLKDLNLYNPDESIEGKLMPKKLHGVLVVQELKDMSLSEIAMKVYEFLQTATSKDHFLDLIDWVEERRSLPLVARAFANTEMSVIVSAGHTYHVMDKMDFGWGKVAFGSCHVPSTRKDCIVMTLPSPTNSDDWVVYMHMPVLPSFGRAILDPRCPIKYSSSINDVFAIFEPPTKLGHDQDHDEREPILVNRVYYIEGEQLKRVQLLASENGWRSKLVTFTSLFWKIIALSMEESGKSNKTCNMALAVDGRRRLSEGDGEENEKLVISHFGNVLSMPSGAIKAQDCIVMTLPSPTNSDDWVVYMHMPVKTINYIEAHSNNMFKPLNADYLRI
uniref:Shikimate O-hydroxycinnamoyltransferase-like n=1 Tax=Tanacetum cinerariifolium TaxID=118510 RepID=A0A699GPJ9_TANCI|nr:shikimate O-hydroxycinnamoyltransferase-like [Tanacetum cinerariifolium]